MKIANHANCTKSVNLTGHNICHAKKEERANPVEWEVKSRLWCSEDDEDFKCVHAPTTPLGSVRSLAYYRSVPLVVTQEGLYPETQVALTRKGRSKSSLRLGLSITKQESNPFFEPLTLESIMSPTDKRNASKWPRRREQIFGKLCEERNKFQQCRKPREKYAALTIKRNRNSFEVTQP